MYLDAKLIRSLGSTYSDNVLNLTEGSKCTDSKCECDKCAKSKRQRSKLFEPSSSERYQQTDVVGTKVSEMNEYQVAMLVVEKAAELLDVFSIEESIEVISSFLEMNGLSMGYGDIASMLYELDDWGSHPDIAKNPEMAKKAREQQQKRNQRDQERKKSNQERLSSVSSPEAKQREKLRQQQVQQNQRTREQASQQRVRQQEQDRRQTQRSQAQRGSTNGSTTQSGSQSSSNKRVPYGSELSTNAEPGSDAQKARNKILKPTDWGKAASSVANKVRDFDDKRKELLRKGAKKVVKAAPGVAKKALKTSPSKVGTSSSKGLSGPAIQDYRTSSRY